MAKTTGEKIYAIRQAEELTMAKFAATIHVSEGYISTIEAGKRHPSPALEDLLLTKHRVSREWWNFGTGPMFIEERRRTNGGGSSIDSIVHSIVTAALRDAGSEVDKFAMAADLRDWLKRRRGK